MTATDTSAAPVITDAAEITDEIRAAAADRSEQRARLIAQGDDEDAAVTQAADEAVLFARSLVQLARRGRTLIELVDAYDGNVYRLLRDLGDHLNLSLAYVDRATVEAHVGRSAGYRHNRLCRAALVAAAEQARSAEKLLRALDDVLDPKQSNARRDLSTRYLRQRVKREKQVLKQAG